MHPKNSRVIENVKLYYISTGTCTDYDSGYPDRLNQGCPGHDVRVPEEKCKQLNNDHFLAEDMCCSCGGGSMLII